MTTKAKTFEQEWIESFSDYDEMKKVMGPYRHRERYTGPNDWRKKIIPRYIFGVDSNPAAYRHDYEYVRGGSKEDRFKADAAFLVDLVSLVKAKKWRWWQPSGLMRYICYNAVIQYYAAVRSHGDVLWKERER